MIFTTLKLFFYYVSERNSPPCRGVSLWALRSIVRRWNKLQPLDHQPLDHQRFKKPSVIRSSAIRSDHQRFKKPSVSEERPSAVDASFWFLCALLRNQASAKRGQASVDASFWFLCALHSYCGVTIMSDRWSTCCS